MTTHKVPITHPGRPKIPNRAAVAESPSSRKLLSHTIGERICLRDSEEGRTSPNRRKDAWSERPRSRGECGLTGFSLAYARRGAGLHRGLGFQARDIACVLHCGRLQGKAGGDDCIVLVSGDEVLNGNVEKIAQLLAQLWRNARDSNNQRPPLRGFGVGNPNLLGLRCKRRAGDGKLEGIEPSSVSADVFKPSFTR